LDYELTCIEMLTYADAGRRILLCSVVLYFQALYSLDKNSLIRGLQLKQSIQLDYRFTSHLHVTLYYIHTFIVLWQP